jgi:hypothetical protein
MTRFRGTAVRRTVLPATLLALALIGGLFGLPGGQATSGPTGRYIADAKGDVSDVRADIGQLVPRYDSEFVSLEMDLYGDPQATSSAWTANGSKITWDIDAGANGTRDFVVTVDNPGNGVRATVATNAGAAVPCQTTAFYTPPQNVVIVSLRASCIGRPRQFGVKAHTDFHTGPGAGIADVAPDAGFSSPVVVAIYTPLPRVRRGHIDYLRNSYTSGPGTQDPYGNAGDRLLYVGGLGQNPMVVRVTATGLSWFERRREFGSPTHETIHRFDFGNPGDQPVAGDWDNDGVDTIGVFRAATGTWYLVNDPDFMGGTADIVVRYGSPGDVGVVGDWNDDGVETPGVFRGGRWYLSNSFAGGEADGVFAFGNPSDVPVPGDWNRDGTTTPGVFRGGRWLLTNHFAAAVEHSFTFGSPGDQPAVETVAVAG